MKKILLIFMMSCLLCGSPNQTFSDSGFQLTNIEIYSNGGEGDVGPPHTNKYGDNIIKG